MNITQRWLGSNGACSEGMEWFFGQKETNLTKVVKALIKQKHYDWAVWVINKTITREQRIQYAYYAAKKVLPVYEKAHFSDKRPREALKAVLKYIKNSTEENRGLVFVAWTDARFSSADSEGMINFSALSAQYAAECVIEKSIFNNQNRFWKAVWYAMFIDYSFRKTISEYGLRFLKGV